MGLKTKYILKNDTGYEQEYPEAYLKVQKVQSANPDYEFFEVVNDPEHPDIAERLSWINRLESNATVYVWADEIARKNRANPIHWFSFEFNYDLQSLDNIYQQVYAKLHQLFKDSEDLI
jgi:hypothetical protein